jgi:hypothetical protein
VTGDEAIAMCAAMKKKTGQNLQNKHNHSVDSVHPVTAGAGD